jgi:hypothetical protein
LLFAVSPGPGRLVGLGSSPHSAAKHSRGPLLRPLCSPLLSSLSSILAAAKGRFHAEASATSRTGDSLERSTSACQRRSVITRLVARQARPDLLVVDRSACQQRARQRPGPSSSSHTTYATCVSLTTVTAWPCDSSSVSAHLPHEVALVEQPKSRKHRSPACARSRKDRSGP